MVEQNTDFEKLLSSLSPYIEKQIPFNKLLGLRVESLDLDSVSLGIEMRDELIGNTFKGILHGGVISSVLDVTGGITATMGVLRRMVGRPLDEILTRLQNVGTIDLRVDYLRPGRGDYFRSAGSIMRTGAKVAVIRMELRNDKDVLIAVGTGTYIVG